MFRVSCLGICWRHKIWKPEKLTSDYLKNEKNFQSEIKNIFLILNVFLFRHTKHSSKDIADTVFKYSEVNNLYWWAMPQKLLPNGFKWFKNTSQFNNDFIKSCKENRDEEYFLQVDIQYP